MTAAWDRISRVAADRFLAEGYAAVSLRTLGEALDLRPASLYHHCPGGKSELFVRSVSERFAAVEQAVLLSGRGDGCLSERLVTMSEVLLDAPLVDLQRLFFVDLPRLRDPAARAQVSEAAHEALLGPFCAVVAEAQATGEAVDTPSPEVVAAAVVAIVTNLGQLHLKLAGDHARPLVSEQVASAIGLLARGLRAHPVGEPGDGSSP